MDKETIKQIINDFIDSVDEIQDFSISNEVEEVTPLNSDWKVFKPNGITNIYITACKEQNNGNSTKI